MDELLIDKNDKRIVWLDFVKFIAIFMMIAVHCTDNVTPAERSEPWYNLWGSFYGSFMRPAIPLFVMVTGALLCKHSIFRLDAHYSQTYLCAITK